MIGAGVVDTRFVRVNAVVVGNPVRIVGYVDGDEAEGSLSGSGESVGTVGGRVDLGSGSSSIFEMLVVDPERTARRRSRLRTLLCCGPGQHHVYPSLYFPHLPTLPYLASYTVAYLLGVGLGYVLNAVVVFRVRLDWRGLLRMPLVYGVQLGAGNAVLWLAVSQIGVDRRVALLAGIAVGVPLTFTLSRFLLVGPGAPGRASRSCIWMQEGSA